MDNPTSSLSEYLLAWFDLHGRKDLPWQVNPQAYRVWVSEIMLQQTQVITVIAYYERFMQRFPDVPTLAAANLDEVLHLWTGLGYYARARNLHKAARLIVARHDRQFPLNMDTLMALPGIGRSTAGAILSLAAGQRHAILDGNVKRVLTRVHAIPGWPGSKAVEQRLWTLAEQHTPAARTASYTQAIMDLGATVCTRTRPACPRCPLSGMCIAHAQGRETAYPGAKPRRVLPLRQTQFLMLRNPRFEVLLQQRPPAGIWGGLWGFPEMPAGLAGAELTQWCREHLGMAVDNIEFWPVVRHTFSHFQLDITPVAATLNPDQPCPQVMEAAPVVWYNKARPDRLGLAAPVRQLLSLLPYPKENTT